MGGAPIATRTASRTIAAITPTWPDRRRLAISAGPMLHTPGTYSDVSSWIGAGALAGAAALARAAKVDSVMGLAPGGNGMLAHVPGTGVRPPLVPGPGGATTRRGRAPGSGG